MTDDSVKLWRAALARGWNPLRAWKWQIPETSDAEIAIYGEPIFTSLAAEKTGLRLLGPTDDWLPGLDRRWRGRDVSLTTLGQARRLTGPAFIKPAGEKCFDARVYESGALLPAEGLLPEELAVLVQEPVTWEIEYRCFIRDRQVLTASPYWRFGELARTGEDWFDDPEERSAAIHFCHQLLRDPAVHVPGGIVVDVGTIGGTWAVVEANAAWASGTYGCDASSVLDVLLAAVTSV